MQAHSVEAENVDMAGARIQDAIRYLAATATIETSTMNAAEIDMYAKNVAAGSDVFIPWLPRESWKDLVDVAARLRRDGVNPVPHVCARKLASHADAEAFLAALRIHAGVTRVLLIAGETEQKEPAFASSVDLLATGLLQAHGIRSVGIAGHPEGHPVIAVAELDAAMDEKIKYAAAYGIELFIVTQFCFDGQTVVDWLTRLRTRGVTLPVHVGVAGPASVATLLKYAMRCGVGASIRTLTTRAMSLTRLIEKNGADNLLRVLAPHADTLGVGGLHLFPFGGFMRSVDWIRKVVAEGL